MSDHPSSPDARQSHWDERYGTIGATEVSWHEDAPTMSLQAFGAAGVTAASSIIDVGGGASRLVDALLGQGFDDLTVLDVSQTALDEVSRRVGGRSQVTWLQTDLLDWEPSRTWNVWHDRAVFHFLTDGSDRATYRTLIRQAVEPGGVIIVATFDEAGPEYCSGLPVVRYDAAGLAAELGSDLEIIATGDTEHRTPAGATQPFTWVALRR